MLRVKDKGSLTDGPIFVRMILFVIPIILTGVLQVMYNMADNIVVGQFSGDPDALGAVGSTSSLTVLVTNVMISLSSGAGVVIAQFFGARDNDKVSRTVHTSMLFSLIGGVVFMIVGILVAGPVLKLIGTQDVYYDKAVLYMIIICCGIPATSIYNFGAAILRSVGDSKTSLYILSISGLVNVVLNLVFVIGCGMTVDGVAYATIVSQYISAIWVVIVLMRRRGVNYQLNLRKLRLELKLVSRILRIGLPIAFQSSLFSISNIIITGSINTFPPHVVSARTIAFNIEGITYTVMSAFATTAMTFVGQNYGAKRFSRINKAVLYALIQVAVAGILVAQVEILFGRQLSDLYLSADDPNREAVIGAVLEIFDIMLATYFLCGIMETMSGVLKALGFSVTSMVASLIGLFVRVGWILLLTPTERFHTIFGLFVSYTISWLVTILLLAICFVYVWRKLGIMRYAREEKAKENIIKENI